MTTNTLLSDLCYELDSDRYPSLGSEFFTRLREKYPRAFQRIVVRDDGQSSCRSSASSADNKSVWSLWECNGDYDKAVVKEADGMLIPCSHLSVHERLKRNCDSLSSAKSTGDDLLAMLRSFRGALLADSKCHVVQNVGGVSISHSSCASSHDNGHSCKDAASNGLPSDSVSRNSSCEGKPLPQDDAIGCSETVGMVSPDSELHPRTDYTGSMFSSNNAERDVPQTQLVAAPDDSNTAADITADNKNQLLSTDGLKTDSSDTELPEEHIHTAATGLVLSAFLHLLSGGVYT